MNPLKADTLHNGVIQAVPGGLAPHVKWGCYFVVVVVVVVVDVAFVFKFNLSAAFLLLINKKFLESKSTLDFLVVACVMYIMYIVLLFFYVYKGTNIAKTNMSA